MVQPAIVIASPMSATKIAGSQQIATTPKVTSILIFLFMPVFFQNSSSIVSLAGKTHSGEAVKTAKNSEKLPFRNVKGLILL